MTDDLTIPMSPGGTPDEAAKPAPETAPVAAPDTLEARVAALEARVDALEARSTTTDAPASAPPIAGPTSGMWECLNPKCANARPSANAAATLFAGPTQAAASEAVTCPACGSAAVIYDHDTPTEDGGKE